MAIKSFQYLQLISAVLGSLRKPTKNRELVRKRLKAIVDHLEKDEINSFLEVAFKYKTVRGAFNLNVRSQNDTRPMVHPLSFPMELSEKVIREIVLENLDHLQSFINFEKLINQAIFYGEYDITRQHLDRAEVELGESMWLIEMNLVYFNITRQTDKLNEYIKNQQKKPFNNIVNLLSQKFSNEQDFYKENVVGSAISTYRKNSHASFADFLNIVLLPSIDLYDFKLEETLSSLLFSRPLDVYIFFRKAVCAKASLDADYIEKISNQNLNYIPEILGDEILMRAEHLNKKSISPPMQTDEHILDKYKSGDYSGVIEDVKALIKNQNFSFSLLEVYSRSLLYTESEEKDDDDAQESIRHEEVDGIPNQPFPDFVPLLFRNALLSHGGESFFTKSLKKYCFLLHFLHDMHHVQSAIESKYRFYNKDSQIQSCKLAYIYTGKLTPKYYQLMTSSEKDNFDVLMTVNNGQSGLCDTRKERAELFSRVNIENPKFEEIKKSLKRISAHGDLLPGDYSYLHCSILIKLNAFDDLLSYVCDEIITSDSNIYHYPIDYILNNQEKSSNKKQIDLTIIICLSYKYSNLADQEDASEALEDFIESSGFNLPSQFIEKFDKLEGKWLFFFKEVCNTELMTELHLIQTNQELLFERLRIISKINRITGMKHSDLESEESIIYAQLTRQQLLSNHLNSKIYINIQELKSTRKEDYKSFLEVYKEIDDESLKRNVIEQKDNDSGPVTLDNVLLTQAFSMIFNDYINNDKYGLDRYLSSEIRHGSFKNQIRSVFEASHLVTSIDEDGNYEFNHYWREILRVTFTPSFVQKIDEILKEFSKDIDTILDESNERFSINRGDYKNKGMFTFKLTEEAKKDIKFALTESNNIDELFISIDKLVWKMINASVEKIKRLINETLRASIEDALQNLETRIESLRSETPTLKDAIGKARQQFLEQLTEITGWFNQPNEQTKGRVLIKDAIIVAVNHVQGIYSPMTVGVAIPKSNLNKKVDYQQAANLIRALVTALLNSIKYRKEQSQIQVETLVQDKSRFITIKNRISEEQYNYIQRMQIIENFTPETRSPEKRYLNTEGGTGFYKSDSFLKDAFGEGSIFSISADKNHFYQVFEFVIGDSHG